MHSKCNCICHKQAKATEEAITARMAQMEAAIDGMIQKLEGRQQCFFTEMLNEHMEEIYFSLLGMVLDVLGYSNLFLLHNQN
jgi:hypothetical protein